MLETQADMKGAAESGNVLDAYRVLIEQALSNVASPELHLAAAGYVPMNMGHITGIELWFT